LAENRVPNGKSSPGLRGNLTGKYPPTKKRVDVQNLLERPRNVWQRIFVVLQTHPLGLEV
jgi:hypothetical protein